MIRGHRALTWAYGGGILLTRLPGGHSAFVSVLVSGLLTAVSA